MLLLLLALLTAASCSPVSSELPKPSYARTMLKVSRSLPGETEELKVRTSEGNLATLIVKRREKSIPTEQPSEQPPSAEAPTTIGYRNVEVDPWNRLQTWSSVSSEPQEARNWIPLSRDSWRPVAAPEPTPWQPAEPGSRGFQTLPTDNNPGEKLVRYALLPHDPPRRAVRTNIGSNLMKNSDAKNVPPEVVVRSEISVKPQPGQPGQPGLLRRSPMSLDADGTPVVHGRRVPDEPADKVQVWRNARVINDQLVTEPGAASTTGSPEAGQNFQSFFEDVNRR